MTAEAFFARSWSVIAALLVLFITGGGFAVFNLYYKRWKDGRDESFNSQAWTGLVVVTMLDTLLFAVLDVGQAFPLVSEGWGAIVGISTSIILPILGYKSVQNITASKKDSTTTNTTINSSTTESK